MSSQIFAKPLPYIALLSAFIIWAINYSVAKVALTEIPPLTLAFLRFGLACVFLVPFFIIHTKKNLPAGRQVKIDKKDLPKFIAFGVFAISLNITFFFEGLKRTSAIDASALTLVIPVFSVLLGWIIFKEKIYLVNLFGILFGIIGALIIIDLPKILLGDFSPADIIGKIFIILSGICWVISGFFAKNLLTKYPSLILTTIGFLTGTITFLIPAAREYIQDPLWITNVTIFGIICVIYMTLLSSISAYFLFEWGLAKTSVAKANMFQYIEPPIAAFFAVMILGETITPPFIFGIILIFAGVYLGTLSKEAHHKVSKIHRV